MDEAGTNPPRNYSIVDKSWTSPTTAKKEIINPCREMRQERTPLGQNRHGLWAPGMEQFLTCCKVSCEIGLYIGIEWPKETNLDAFARRTLTASDFTCPADAVS